MVRNAHCQTPLRSRLSGTVQDSVASVFMNIHYLNNRFIFILYVFLIYCHVLVILNRGDWG